MEETAVFASVSAGTARPRLAVNKPSSSLIETTSPTTVRPRLTVNEQYLNAGKAVSIYCPPWQAHSSLDQGITEYKLIILLEPLRRLLDRPFLDLVLQELHQLRDIATRNIRSLTKRASAKARSHQINNTPNTAVT
jgi:hypothetical protein